MKVRAKWLILAGVLVVAGLAAAFGLNRGVQAQHFTAKVERGEIDDVVDARGLHRFERRDVPRQQQRLVRRDHAHVAVVEVMELPVGEMTRGIVEQVAHGERVRL